MTTTVVIASFGIISLLLLQTSLTQVAMAQVMSPQAQQIIEDTRAYCDRLTSDEVYPGICVSLPHESPTTLVLGGDLLLIGLGRGNIDNIFIWQAVDGFKALDYTIDSVLLTGQGSADNPHTLMIVMSK